MLRMAACGQTAVHLPHWMQRVGSHSGRSRARLRFSYWEVPFGKVPSTGIWLTGMLSPSPHIILPSTSWTYSGAFADMTAGMTWPLTVLPVVSTWCRLSSVASTAAIFLSTTSCPFLA